MRLITEENRMSDICDDSAYICKMVEDLYDKDVPQIREHCDRLLLIAEKLERYAYIKHLLEAEIMI